MFKFLLSRGSQTGAPVREFLDMHRVLEFNYVNEGARQHWTLHKFSRSQTDHLTSEKAEVEQSSIRLLVWKTRNDGEPDHHGS